MSSAEPSAIMNESPVRRTMAPGSTMGPHNSALFSSTSFSDEVAHLLELRKAPPSHNASNEHPNTHQLATGRDDLMSPASNAGLDASAAAPPSHHLRLQSNPPSAARMRGPSNSRAALRSSTSTPRLGGGAGVDRVQSFVVPLRAAQLNAQRSFLESAAKRQTTLCASFPSTTQRSSARHSAGSASARPFHPVAASQFFASAAPPLPSARGDTRREPSFLHGATAGTDAASSLNLHPATDEAQQNTALTKRRACATVERGCTQCGGIVRPVFNATLAAELVDCSPITEFEYSMATKLQALGRSLRCDVK